MRKLVLFICLLSASLWTYAQEDCMSFCAKETGLILISRSYDANDNLLKFIANIEEFTETKRVTNCEYNKTEYISTPAGTFHAAKRSLVFNVNRNDKVKTCKRVEWYGEGVGIVRSETYDETGNLESYTVLTKIHKNNSR